MNPNVSHLKHTFNHTNTHARTHARTYTDTHIHIYTYTEKPYILIFTSKYYFNINYVFNFLVKLG